MTSIEITQEPGLFNDADWALLQESGKGTIQEAAATTFTLGELAMRFARVERVPRYDEESRENDAEHSFMLGLVATELAIDYFPDLDSGLVAQFSLVHDLVELETADVATFILDDSELAAKADDELAALPRVLAALPRATSGLLWRYELQQEPEARFVRLVDKILPVIVDIAGPGRKVMEEDYGVFTTEQLDENEDKLQRRFRQNFPEASFDLLHAVRDTLAARFQGVFAAPTV